MPRAVSVIEAKDRLDALPDEVAQRGDEVIVERQGEPAAVLVPFAADQEVVASRERQRRAHALALLERLAEGARVRHADLTFEQAEAIAEELSQAAIASLAERGEVTFERDRCR